MINEFDNIILFNLDDQKYAIDIKNVERIIQSVQLVGLPDSPKTILGVAHVQGKVIPVINIRRKFHLKERGIDLNDHFIIVSHKGQKFILPVERVQLISTKKHIEFVNSKEFFPNLQLTKGALRLKHEVIPIIDLKKLLIFPNSKKIEPAIKAGSDKNDSEQ